MNMPNLKPLEEIVRERPDLKSEVEDFANFLWVQRTVKTYNENGRQSKNPPFNKLEGCLKHHTSTEQEMKDLKQIWEPKL